MTRYFKSFSSTDHAAISLNVVVMGEIRDGTAVYAYKEDEKNGMSLRIKAPTK
ncbi:MAG TPA: hypothetical protein VIF60_22800 [Burkholderiaceae bacterium]|jgi:branched-chain amino acid transport system substrate-binding protein